MSGEVPKKKNKLSYGVGINDANYFVQTTTPVKWMCPYYQRWRGILRRCYDKKYHEKYPTYIGCTVCEEWLTFSKFKSWMETQDWEGKELDKDLLANGSKLYSPETCAFILPRTNVFLTNCENIKLSFLSNRKVFRVKVGNGFGKEIFVGDFKILKDAKESWIRVKCEIAEELSKMESDLRIKYKLLNLKETLNESSSNRFTCN